MLRRNIIFCCCLLFTAIANAQQSPAMDKATTLITEAGNVFKNGAVLMNVSYTYANEHTPDIPIDSLRGSMLISGENYRGELGNTLTVKNSRYSIIVFKDDKLLYVSRFKPGNEPASMSPIQLITNAIQTAGVKDCQITEQKDLTVLRFDFPEQMSYRYMQIEINKKDKSIATVSYLIRKTALLQDQQDGSGDAYAKVKTKFNYQKLTGVSTAEFDERQFFIQKDNSLLPAPAYQDYEVFIGSPSN